MNCLVKSIWGERGGGGVLSYARKYWGSWRVYREFWVEREEMPYLEGTS